VIASNAKNARRALAEGPCLKNGGGVLSKCQPLWLFARKDRSKIVHALQRNTTTSNNAG
jgi:hypothetical protein